MDGVSENVLVNGNGPTTLINGYHDSSTTTDTLNTPSSHTNDDCIGLPERYNDPAKPWIVQKFGGTSVAKAMSVIAQDIIGSWMGSHRVIAVSSARSRGVKATGTTQRLIRAAKEAANGQRDAWEETLHEIRTDHISASQALVSERLRKSVNEEVEASLERLHNFLSAIQEIGELSAKSLDVVISKGELLACFLLTAQLRDIGIQARTVDLSDIVDFEEDTGDLDDAFYQRLTNRLRERVLTCDNMVPVLTGYFGPLRRGLLDQVGRGYSDLCAALVAIGLHADELQIWKEIDGIFTANPSKVPTAKLLSSLSPAEAAELTFYGSEVIHPFTMEKVIKARIPIKIRNVLNLRNPGTSILPEPILEDKALSPPPSPTFFRVRSCSRVGNGQRPPRPTAITVKGRILILNVHSNKRSLSHGFFANIFSTLSKWQLSVDLISTSEVHVSMALHSKSALVSAGGDEEREIVDSSLKGAVNDLTQYGTVEVIPNMVILSLVGRQMKHMIGIAGKMFSCLAASNINIEMISQGASEINISCVIEDRDSDRAQNILHSELFTYAE